MPHIPIVANNSGSVWHPTAYQGCLLPYGFSPSNSLGLAFVFIRKESHPPLCGESRRSFRYGFLRLPFRLPLPRTSLFMWGALKKESFRFPAWFVAQHKQSRPCCVNFVCSIMQLNASDSA